MKKGTPPTRRQLVVLFEISRYRQSNGYAPSIRELGASLGIRSTNGVQSHLVALARRGLLARGHRVARALFVTPLGRHWLSAAVRS